MLCVGYTCLERCARSGRSPLAKPICGFAAAAAAAAEHSEVFSFPCALWTDGIRVASACSANTTLAPCSMIRLYPKRIWFDQTQEAYITCVSCVTTDRTVVFSNSDLSSCTWVESWYLADEWRQTIAVFGSWTEDRSYDASRCIDRCSCDHVPNK